MLKRFIFAALLAPMLAMGDVLLWEVNENSKVDGGDIKLFLSPYGDDAGARVKLTDANGTILDVWYDNPEDPPARWEDCSLGVWIGDVGGGYWGTGWNQSETGHKTWATTTDPPDVFLEHPDAIEVMFIMELGYVSWDDNLNDWAWETLAESSPETYSYLRSRYMYGQGTIDPPIYTAWAPDFHATPEPSSFLLSLIGCSFLLLRRKESHGQI